MDENEDTQGSAVRRFSSFTPILILVLSFLFVNVIQLTNTISQRSELKKIQAQLDEVIPQVKKLNDTVDGLFRDLMAIAPSSPAAQKLLTDFQVRVTEPAGGAAPAPAPKP